MTTPMVTDPGLETEIEPQHTGGMVALIPAPEYAVKLAVAGGLPAGELHLTLCYLGDDVTTWPPQVVAAVQQAALELTDPSAAMGEAAEDAEADEDDDVAEAAAGLTGPLTLNVFAWSQFNPTGGLDGQEPCMVYQFSGNADYRQVAILADTTADEMKEAIGEALFPDQYDQWVPHVTAGYGLPANALTYTGPVVFDRLRVALAGQNLDLPLAGDSSMAAAALTRTPSGSVTAKSRQKAKAAGHTMPGTDSFPIENGTDLDHAVPLAGQAEDPIKARKWIMARAKALKLTFKIPDTWRSDGTIQASAAQGSVPDVPQSCEYSEHPAVRSFLFAEGQRYVAVCDEHASRAQHHIVASGGTVAEVIEIRIS